MSRTPFSKLLNAELLTIYNRGDLVGPSKYAVKEYGLSIPLSYKIPKSRDLFTDSARPGETRADCKARMHAEQRTMGIFTYAKKGTKLIPRTKREKALVDQTIQSEREAAYNAGFESGVRQGEERERQRSEKFALRLVAAQAKGVTE